MIDANKIVGDDDIDTALLRSAAFRAENYLRSFKWCQQMYEGEFIEGIGGIFGLFLFRVNVAKVGKSVWLWVFHGDVPPVYLEAAGYSSPYSAAQRYIDGLTQWIDAVRSGHNLAGLIPINYPIDDDSLSSLETRIATLRTYVLPDFNKEPLKRLLTHE